MFLTKTFGRNSGIEESHIQLSRDGYGRKNVCGFYHLPGDGRWLCSVAEILLYFSFLFFSKHKALNKHQTPAD